jgi:hypothetical protein
MAEQSAARADLAVFGVRIGEIVSVVALLLSVVSFTLSVRQFRETQEQQRHDRAVEHFIKYNELMRGTTNEPNADYWKNNLALAIAEAIYLLQDDDAGWVETVKEMLTAHRSFIQDGRSCGTYEVRFQQLMNEVTDPDVCPQEQTSHQ